MRKILILICSLLLVGCSTIKYVPIENETIVNYVDSVCFRDSTVYHHIYKEHYKEYAGLLDTLRMETEYSKFTAYNDTTSNTLKGEAVNKDKDIPVQIKWKEKIVYKDVEKKVEVPVPVEVEKKVIPKWTYWSLGFNILILLAVIARLIIKIWLKW